MDNSEIKVILSERGKELAYVGTFKYRFIGSIKKGELLKWRCTKNNCTAMIYSGPDKNIVIKSSGQHKHKGNSPNKLERQVLRENCKRRAEESLSTQPLKLIRSELLNEQSSIVHKDLKTVRKAMYDRRRKVLPKLPKSQDIFLQLNLMKTQDDFKFRGQPFIHIPEDNSFVCITSDFNLLFMIKHDCIDFFADGSQFILKKLHVDFEKAAHQAAYEVFENVQLIACRFHLGQSWWRKINSDSILRIAYKKENDELGNWLKSFFGLAFLPNHEVADAFVELMSVCPNDKVCSEFRDYVFNNYIDDESPFPPNIWAKEPMFDPRTTNAVESFHRTYNSQFYKSHPHIHLVIMVLQETQAETMTKIRSIETDSYKSMSFIEMQKINATIMAYDEYLRNKCSKDLLKYLLKVGNKYLGIPL
ncbi:unnamed protein product [Macrosiphum euphorbiae]|uniref:FLYWCH-type domain-containing protein n=1 Tax=Macrosiphum euphorbiae TaxID=13131 RepID=A0AAV0VWT1_9HEMI|nr:unnamed protein product [Macrosiphum euphorbiae]